jgi:pullulanase/glycogen debranching enzyme
MQNLIEKLAKLDNSGVSMSGSEASSKKTQNSIEEIFSHSDNFTLIQKVIQVEKENQDCAFENRRIKTQRDIYLNRVRELENELNIIHSNRMLQKEVVLLLV